MNVNEARHLTWVSNNEKYQNVYEIIFNEIKAASIKGEYSTAVKFNKDLINTDAIKQKLYGNGFNVEILYNLDSDNFTIIINWRREYDESK